MSTPLTLSEGLALASVIDAHDGTTSPVPGGSAEVAAMLRTAISEMRRRAELLDTTAPATRVVVIADEAQHYATHSGANQHGEVAS